MIQQPFPDNGVRNACWYFLTQTEIIHKHTELPLQHFTKKYSGYCISKGNGGTLLASSSKDNTRVEWYRLRWIPMVLQSRIEDLYFYLLTSGIGSHLVCQARPAYSSMSYSNLGDYEGRTGLSPPCAYPSTEGYEANKGSLQPRHHVYAIDYYSSIVQGDPSLSGALYQSILHRDG